MPAFVRSVFLVFAMAIPIFGDAANLVTEGDFDTDPVFWIPNQSNMAIAWDTSRNVVGIPGSGSGFVSNNHPLSSEFAVFQCSVMSGVVPGLTYDFGAWILIPSGQANTGSAKVEVVFLDATDCLGQPVGVPVDAVGPATLDTWSLTTSSVLAPAGAVSAQINLVVQKNLDGASYSVDFDGVRFGPTPTTPVQLQQFSVE